MIPPEDFLSLCNIFGACSKRSQGAGGNISVKQDTILWIKASGARLSSISKKSGYACCNINLLHDLYVKENENLQTALAYAESEPPSMETFFHLLPCSHIVHIHPSFFCKFLCSNESKSIFTTVNFPSSLYIPYTKPGYLLAKKIFSLYTNESVIFLENHGVIFLANSSESVIKLYIDIVALLESITKCKDSASSLSVEYQLYKLTNEFAKPIYFLNKSLPKLFVPITPDHFLFLKDLPLITTKECLSTDLQKYRVIPSILSIDSQIYALGKTIEQAQSKEEYLQSYIEIYDNSTRLSDTNMSELIECSKEKLRLSKE
jgi:rhamnose utilization protein RhaD (predicted bifunctional aldolase and dehydrogenase)